MMENDNSSRHTPCAVAEAELSKELEASHKREMKLMVDLARASDIIRALESELATVREELNQTQTLLATQLEKTDPLGNGLF